MKARIRKAASADAEALATLHALCFEARWSAAALCELLAAPGAIALIAEDEDRPCGFVLARVAGDEAEILTLAVDPAGRRRGCGRDLVRSAAAAAEKSAARRLFLEVAVDNRAALGLYAALGFAEAGRRKAYYVRESGPAGDALIMSVDLPLSH